MIIADRRAEEWERLKRRGLTTELPDEWVEAVRGARVPDEFAPLLAYCEHQYHRDAGASFESAGVQLVACVHP